MLKEKLLSGQKIYGTMIRLMKNPALCYIAKNAGLDFVMYDCEHSNYSIETLHDLFLMGNALNLDGFVRVPELSKDNVSRVLDQGAHGVMVPMLETKEMADLLVKYSKYQPIGGRGYTGDGAHVYYASGGKHLDVMEKNNNTVISIAQIETKMAVENAEQIASTEGIDALLIGPNDLSLSLGIPGDLFNPIEIEAIEHIASMCKKYNKAFGLHAGPDLVKKFYKDLDIVMINNDTSIITAGFKNLKKTFDSLKD